MRQSPLMPQVPEWSLPVYQFMVSNGVAQVVGKSPHYSQRVAPHRASDRSVG